MTTLADVNCLMGDQGQKLQVLFIAVNSERETLPLHKEYMTNFDLTFLALRPTPAELNAVAGSFKINYRKAEGSTHISYTMDHSAGKYVFDTESRVRLFSRYGSEPGVIAQTSSRCRTPWRVEQPLPS